jgi:hypothetical protein
MTPMTLILALTLISGIGLCLCCLSNVTCPMSYDRLGTMTSVVYPHAYIWSREFANRDTSRAGDAGSGRFPHPRGGHKPSPRCSLCGAIHSRKISCLENWRRDLRKGK